MDLRREVNEFVNTGRSLLIRLRSLEAEALTDVDLHIFRVQLYLMENEAANMVHLRIADHLFENAPPNHGHSTDSAQATSMASGLIPVWVTAHRTNSQWSFVVSDDDPHTLHLSNPTAGSIPLDKFCATYEALSDSLR